MLPKQIHIPNPCHEDWSKMSPTQKGAFCASCKKEVFDFTKSTNEEIKESLSKAAEPCIRISQKKLDEMNFLEWFNHLRLRIQLNYVFLLGFLVAQSSLMAQELTCHEPQFVAVDSIDELSIDDISKDILYRPLEDELPYYSFIWAPNFFRDSLNNCDLPIGGAPTLWGVTVLNEYPLEEDYILEITANMGDIGAEWMEPKINEIKLNPDAIIVYGGVQSIDDQKKDIGYNFMDKTASDHEVLVLGFNTYEFEIIENQLFFSYDAKVEQEIHLKIGQDPYGPFASSHNNILFSGPLKVKAGNKSIIIPLDGYLSGTYFIQINANHLRDSGRLILF